MEIQLTLLAFTLLILTSLLGAFWLARVRTARRVRAAADAHAERELAQEARWRRPRAAT
jgi:hypothetical protein